jgi:hypothetical protein
MRQTMESTEIGEVILAPLSDGRLQVQHASWPWVTTTWTLAGAREAVAYLQAWIADEELACITASS